MSFDLKNYSHVSSYFSALPTRPANQLLETIFRARGWNDTRIALEMDNGMTALKVKYHFKFDSPNSWFIARGCEVAALPTWPAAWALDGRINKELKRQMDVRVWTARYTVKLAWGLLGDEQERGINRLYKFFDNGSTDSFVIASLCEIFNMETLPASFFLNKGERESLKQKRQMELPL